MQKSTHKCEVFRVTDVYEHPNADQLELVKYYDYQTVVRKGDFKRGDLAVFIPPDSLVDTERQEFAFLHKNRKQERITVKKLRGAISMGLVLKAPDNLKVGDDAADQLGIEHYEPELRFSRDDDNVKPPSVYAPKYDIDTLRKYAGVFQYGETVYVTEKIHGASAKYVYHNGTQYCGSRNNWKKQSDTNQWWRALHNHPSVGKFCIENPDTVLYGEIYGQVQDMKYGKKDVYFLAFDIMRNGTFLNVKEFLSTCTRYDIPVVPILGIIPFDMNVIEGLSNGISLIAEHCREGCVIKPLIERTDSEIGRVCLKLVGNDYYTRKAK